MEYVSERASGEDWTCEVRFRSGGLPDVAALARCLAESGQGARLRGVEGTVDGWLSEQNGALWLTLEDTAERVRLGPLSRKVQWQPKPDREQPMTPAERTAYMRLRGEWRARGPFARITGPLVPDEGLGPGRLEIRRYAWR